MDAYVVAQGWTYLAPRDVWMVGMVNLTGFGVLIATAYGVGWFRRQPWRQPPQAQPQQQQAAGPTRPMPAE